MSIRTTVTLDDDVVERLKERAAEKRMPFKQLLNQVLRLGLLADNAKPRTEGFSVPTHRAGLRAGLSYDKVEDLLEYAEGPLHR